MAPNNLDPPPAQLASFTKLQPQQVLTAVEEGLGQPATARCQPLNSYINRVYEVELENNISVIAKFYRPGRWPPAALAEEHAFTLELQDLDLPVIAPLILTNGQTLGQCQDITYAIFPKKGGRFLAELQEEQWVSLGHLLGRIHRVGASKPYRNRIDLHPKASTTEQLNFLLAGDFIPAELHPAYAKESQQLLDLITPLFAEIKPCRIHGDCHFGNLVLRPSESFFLFDFDDMANGPAVQDLWMMLPGYHQDCLPEIELFLEGYETFYSFDRRQLALIEALRAMRYIHFTAWCAHQVAQPQHNLAMGDNWGSGDYWLQEINDLRNQRQRIELGIESKM